MQWFLGILFLATSSSFAGELPDIEVGLEKGKCTKFPMPGADQYFTGHWTVSEDGFVKGIEKRILFANSKWKSTRGPDKRMGGDCVVVWDITGHKSAPTTCTGCSFGVKFNASINYEKSTCPQRLVNEGAYKKGLKVDVSLKSDGTSTLYAATSGKPIANGKHASGAFNYKTKHTCVWF